LDLAEYWRSVGGEMLSRRFGAALRETLDGVLLFPRAGAPLGMRVRRLRGTRTWRVRGFENYVIYYREVDGRIEVLHVLHAARDHERILRAPQPPDEPA
jgi:plasmid stabilization system protein ParE